MSGLAILTALYLAGAAAFAPAAAREMRDTLHSPEARDAGLDPDDYSVWAGLLASLLYCLLWPVQVAAAIAAHHRKDPPA